MGANITYLLRRWVRGAANFVGVDFYRQQPDYHYVPNYYGRSAHKQFDIRSLPLFGELADTTVQHGKALLYYDRLYMIYQALLMVKRLDDSSGDINLAEVGVYKGGTSRFIASTSEALGLKKAVLHCFDTFEGHASEDLQSGLDALHAPGGFNDTQFETVKTYLSGFNNVLFYKGRFQDSCSSIETKKFHFVHLDVDIYEPTIFALDFFDSRLASGGVIIVDDYGFTSCPGAKLAVDEFAEANRNYFKLHLLTGQCMLLKYDVESR